MKANFFLAACLVVTSFLAGCKQPPGDGSEQPTAASGLRAASGQRDQIRIVGSSTVYPFATKVAEMFGKTTSFKTPVIESTGS